MVGQKVGHEAPQLRLFSQAFVVRIVIFQVATHEVQDAPIFNDHGRGPVLTQLHMELISWITKNSRQLISDIFWAKKVDPLTVIQGS